MDIIRNQQFQFLLTLITPIAAAFVIYIMQRSKKKFNYEIISNFPLLSDDKELKERIEIYYEDKKVENIQSILLKFYNSGNLPIQRNDFDKDLLIIIHGDVQILSTSIIDSKPQNLTVRFEVKDNKIIIGRLLLNPKDTFTIRIIISGIVENVKVDCRIIGIKEIVKGLPSINKLPKLLLVTGIISYLLDTSFLFYMYYNRIYVDYLFIMGLIFCVISLSIVFSNLASIKIFEITKSAKLQ